MKGRLTDWRARLHEFLRANETRPFVWGEWDCCIGLMAGAVMAMTGRDYAVGYRGTYKGPVAATRMLLRRDGVSRPEALMRKWFGRRRHPAHARTGDLVLYRDCIGVMDGNSGVFIGCEMMGEALAREGLVRVDRGDLEACWHV